MFGKWLAEELERQGISQYALAKKIGVTQSHINHVVNGRRNPSNDLCEKIARGLLVPPEVVYRAAGLDIKISGNPTDEDLLNLFDQLNKNEQNDILEWIRLKVEQNKNKKQKGVGDD